MVTPGRIAAHVRPPQERRRRCFVGVDVISLMTRRPPVASVAAAAVPVAPEHVRPAHGQRLGLGPALGAAVGPPHLPPQLLGGAVAVEGEGELLADLLTQSLAVDGGISTRVPHKLQHGDEDGERQAADQNDEDAADVVHVQGSRLQALALVLALTGSVVVPPFALQILRR